jgi:predicted phage gp36 major capsid-like protein
VYMPAKEKEKLAQDAALRAQVDEAERAKKEAQQALADVKRLQEDLASAKDEKSRAEIEARLAAAQEDLRKKSAPAGGGRPAGGGTPAGAGAAPKTGGGSKCPPGDPLCGF